jgi:hypothetical protein
VSASEWKRDEQQLRAKRCQVAAYPTSSLEPVAPPCGQTAAWWTDDMTPGVTVWMCEGCAQDFMRHTDNVSCEEIDR